MEEYICEPRFDFWESLTPFQGRWNLGQGSIHPPASPPIFGLYSNRIRGTYYTHRITKCPPLIFRLSYGPALDTIITLDPCLIWPNLDLLLLMSIQAKDMGIQRYWCLTISGKVWEGNQFQSQSYKSQVKVRFTQKMLVKLSHCHSSEPFFAPGLLFPVNGINSSDKMSIFSFFCINQSNLLN